MHPRKHSTKHASLIKVSDKNALDVRTFARTSTNSKHTTPAGANPEMLWREKLNDLRPKWERERRAAMRRSAAAKRSAGRATLFVAARNVLLMLTFCGGLHHEMRNSDCRRPRPLTCPLMTRRNRPIAQPTATDGTAQCLARALLHPTLLRRRLFNEFTWFTQL